MNKSINSNIQFIKNQFSSSINPDIIIREFTSGSNVRCFLVYIDGMASTQWINQFIMQPIMANQDESLDLFHTVSYNDCTKSTKLDDAVSRVLKGDTAVFADGLDYFVICETKQFDKRSVSEPLTESVIKGSHEGFNESIRSNITLLRRIIQSQHFISEMITVGKENNTSCAVIYMKGITNQRLVSRVKRRLRNIHADYISGSGMVMQLIEDNKNSIFPSMLTTERPDRAAQYIMAGRIIVICDNSPYAMILPIDMGVLFDSPEGNNQRWQIGSFERFLRAFAFILTTTISAVYLAILNFHQDFMPSDFINLILESRQNIPFSAFVEIIVMELMFEMVREAGLRVPSAAGSAVGVVGGLILGQAAIDANLVSPATLIVVAISGVSNAVIPDYDLSFSIKFLRFAYIIAAQFFGIVGVCCAIVLSLMNIANNESLGVSMIAEEFATGYGNIVYQKPLWKQEKRLRSLMPVRRKQQPNISRGWDE